MRRTVEKAAAVAAAGSGEQRGSSVGGTGAAVAAMVEVGAAAVAAVSSRLAGGLGLVLIPAWTHRRGRERDSEPGNHIFYFSNAGKQECSHLLAEPGGFP